MIRSYEPGEDWFWDFRTEEAIDGPELAPPYHRPQAQGSPAPAGRLPADWRQHLH